MQGRKHPYMTLCLFSFHGCDTCFFFLRERERDILDSVASAALLRRLTGAGGARAEAAAGTDAAIAGVAPAVGTVDVSPVPTAPSAAAAVIAGLAANAELPAAAVVAAAAIGGVAAVAVAVGVAEAAAWKALAGTETAAGAATGAADTETEGGGPSSAERPFFRWATDSGMFFVTAESPYLCEKKKKKKKQFREKWIEAAAKRSTDWKQKSLSLFLSLSPSFAWFSSVVLGRLTVDKIGKGAERKKDGWMDKASDNWHAAQMGGARFRLERHAYLLGIQADKEHRPVRRAGYNLQSWGARQSQAGRQSRRGRKEGREANKRAKKER
jgi:hypothetical protein